MTDRPDRAPRPTPSDAATRHETWQRERLDPALGRAPERKPRFSTISDLPIDRLYGPWSLGDDAEARIGLPGEPPFTRGIHPTGYRSRLWTMRMFPGFGAAEDTNQRFHQLLAAGQTGLSIAYDMPTLYGYDTDDPEAEGEFGTCGVGVSSLADMEVLLDGLPLERVSTSMTINSPAGCVNSVTEQNSRCIKMNLLVTSIKNPRHIPFQSQTLGFGFAEICSFIPYNLNCFHKC
jgi:methylmalonyl-CoA mutase N-terminal domain/subunit